MPVLNMAVVAHAILQVLKYHLPSRTHDICESPNVIFKIILHIILKCMKCYILGCRLSIFQSIISPSFIWYTVSNSRNRNLLLIHEDYGVNDMTLEFETFKEKCKLSRDWKEDCCNYNSKLHLKDLSVARSTVMISVLF